MTPQDTPHTVHQSQSKLWLYAGVPALALIAYLIYSAVLQAQEEAEAHDQTPVQESPVDPTDGK